MFVNKEHFRYFELKFINHNYLNFSGQILKKSNSVDLGQKKRFFSNFFCRFKFLIKELCATYIQSWPKFYFFLIFFLKDRE